MRTKICIIVVYLGKPPSWISVWLRSCALNPLIEFLLIVDRPQEIPFVPSNVRLMVATLKDLHDRFSTAVGFSVELNHAYKLCDFKPVYGLALADMVQGFDFWGHSDLDLFYGDMLKFLPSDALEQCLRLYHRGHLSIFRNNHEGNSLYKLPHPTIDIRRIFRTDSYCHFDESPGIEQIVSFNRIPEYENNFAFADIVPKYPDFKLTRWQLNHRYQAFVMENGKAQQLYWSKGEIHRREFMYIHLQKRFMPPADAECFRHIYNWVCTPHGFIPCLPDEWSQSTIKQLNRPNYRHAVDYALKRAARRLHRTSSTRTS
jgi:hypothetical protein